MPQSFRLSFERATLLLTILHTVSFRLPTKGSAKSMFQAPRIAEVNSELHVVALHRLASNRFALPAL